jgi:hypothetical protein
MKPITVHVEGVGLFGPGMPGWESSLDMLAGRTPFDPAPPRLPPVEALPPAERRRVGLVIRLAMTVGFEALRPAGGGAGADGAVHGAVHGAVEAASIATVFSSTGGDCDNCHSMLETLASSERALSPTRFQNSVHNAPAGYWSIATRCEASSTSLCAYDATFAAGLLQAAAQAQCSGGHCLLIAYDTPYPEPLLAVRPIRQAMGIALLLHPERSERALATLAVSATREAATVLEPGALEDLRMQIPVARALPLLQRIARRAPGRVVLEYLEPLQLAVEVSW